MTEEQERKDSGATARDISIESVVLCSSEFVDHLFRAAVLKSESAEHTPDAGDGVSLSADVGVWIHKDHRTAMVRVALKAQPDMQPSWSAMVEFVGRYAAGEDPIVPLEKFAWSNGVAYLIPYIREKLASLTSASMYGTYVLPPISVPKLLSLGNPTATKS